MTESVRGQFRNSGGEPRVYSAPLGHKLSIHICYRCRARLPESGRLKPALHTTDPENNAV